MKAILIDPFTQTVTAVEHKGGIDSIYELIGASPFDVYTINDKGDALYFDDEGLFREGQKAFALRGLIWSGKVLILGSNHETGDSISVQDETVQSIYPDIVWDVPVPAPSPPVIKFWSE